MSIILLSFAIFTLLCAMGAIVVRDERIAEAEDALREDVYVYRETCRELADAKKRITILEASDRGWPKLEYRQRLRGVLDALQQYHSSRGRAAEIAANRVLDDNVARAEELFTPFREGVSEGVKHNVMGGHIVGYKPETGLLSDALERRRVQRETSGVSIPPSVLQEDEEWVVVEQTSAIPISMQASIPLCAVADCPVCFPGGYTPEGGKSC